MEKEEIKKQIYKLRKERQLLEAHCLSIVSQMPLWLSIRYTKCGRKGCKCMKGKMHGPFSYVSFKEGGKLHYRYISGKRLRKIRQGIDNYHSFQKKVARLNAIHEEIISLLKKNQKNNLLPIPKWIMIKKKKG